MKNIIGITFVLLAIMWVPKSYAVTCPSSSFNGGFNGDGYANIYASCESYLNTAQGGVTYAGDCSPTGAWTQILFTRNSDGVYFRCNVYDTLECVSPEIRNTSTGACESPPPPPCSSSAGTTAQFSGSGGSVPGSVCLESDNCSYSLDGVGMILADGSWFSSGTTQGSSCSGQSSIPTESGSQTPGHAPDGCIVDGDGDILCEGDVKDTYNGEELPNGELPDNSCEYVGGDYVCDEVVTTVGDHEVIEGENGSFDREVVDDYRDLAPGTGIDTNGDGITDAIARDFNNDGITDELTNADGTTFVRDNADGTEGSVAEGSDFNDDGSPNYPDGQGHGNEDGSGQGTGECQDDPNTPEDECGDINKSGASTPYCDTEPTCEGDPIQCANLYQNWQILCSSAPAEFHKESLDVFKAGVDDGKEFFDPASDAVDLGEFDFNASATGWGYSRTCPSDIPLTLGMFGTHVVPVSDYCGLMTIFQYFLLISATWISARIFIRGVT